MLKKRGGGVARAELRGGGVILVMRTNSLAARRQRSYAGDRQLCGEISGAYLVYVRVMQRL